MSEEVKPAQDTPEAGQPAPAEKPPVAETPKAPEAPKPDAVVAKPEAEVKKEPVETKEPTEQKPVVPEKYDLKLPEGSVLHPAVVDKIAALAKERGLSNEKAQELLNQESDSVAAAVQQQASAWAEEAKSDPEIGGDGFKENVELSKRVIARFGSDSLKKELDKTGYGNHPELVRLLTKIGKAMDPDRLVIPGTQSGGKKSIEDIFYSTENKES